MIIMNASINKLNRELLNNLEVFRDVNAPIIFYDVSSEFIIKTVIIFCKKLFFNYKCIEGENKRFVICSKIGVLHILMQIYFL